MRIRQEHQSFNAYAAVLLGLGLLSVGCAAEEGDDGFPMATGDTAAQTSMTAGGTGDEDDSDSGSDDDEDEDEGDTEGDTEDDSDSDDSDSDDSDSDDSDSDDSDSGSTAGTCDFDMDVAIKLTMDVSWMGGIAVLEGGGQIDAWILGDLTPEGDQIRLTGTMCNLALPDFSTGLLAGNETYGTEFPASVWANPAMPTIDAFATVSSADPGATLQLERGAVVLGGMMGDALNDPWPASWSGVTAMDHDGDGLPGITAQAKLGGSYSYPRIDILNTDARAQGLYIVSRTIMEFDGIIDDCDSAGGSAVVTMENHAVGCATVGGGECTTAQTDTLDGNMPQFMVAGGNFDLARMADGATCADVIAALP